MEEKKFPKISKSIQDFFEDEDGSITRNKALLMGGMILVLGMLFSDEVYAAHRTHSTQLIAIHIQIMQLIQHMIHIAPIVHIQITQHIRQVL